MLMIPRTTVMNLVFWKMLKMLMPPIKKILRNQQLGLKIYGVTETTEEVEDLQKQASELDNSWKSEEKKCTNEASKEETVKDTKDAQDEVGLQETSV